MNILDLPEVGRKRKRSISKSPISKYDEKTRS